MTVLHIGARRFFLVICRKKKYETHFIPFDDLSLDSILHKVI